MLDPGLEKEIEYITGQIIRKYHPLKIILFGSAAKGMFSQDSDLDLFIIKEDPRPGGDRITDVAGMFEHTVAIDVLVYTPDEVQQCIKWGDPFVNEILAHGRVIYG